MHRAGVLMIPVLPPMVDASIVPHDHVMQGPFVGVPEVGLRDVLLQEMDHLLVFFGVIDSDYF